MSERDELAALLVDAIVEADPEGWFSGDIEDVADAILADGWRWVGTMECMHRPGHTIKRGETEHCGLPLVPREATE